MKLRQIQRLVLTGFLAAMTGHVVLAEQPQKALRVFVSIAPQKWFVDQIGGDRVETMVLLPAGQSAETFSPSPRQVAALWQAQVLFTIGVPFEKAVLDNIRRRGRVRIVDTATGIQRRILETTDTDHDHDAETTSDHHHHEPGELDPHTWMNPLLARQQAHIICETLCALDEAHAAVYRDNYQRVAAGLEELHRELLKSLAPLRDRTLFVFHPAFGYFADVYGLKQVAVETGGKEPSPRQLARLIERARQDRVQAIFVQPQFSSKSAATIARAIGGAVVALDPLAEDYPGNLRHIAVEVNKALGDQ